MNFSQHGAQNLPREIYVPCTVTLISTHARVRVTFIFPFQIILNPD
jgi:hypothetical protein